MRLQNLAAYHARCHSCSAFSSKPLSMVSEIVPPRSRTGLVVTNETTQQRLARAKGYPYARPDTSFIFCNGRPYTFPCRSWVPPAQWAASRQPLLQLQVAAPDGSSSSLEAVLQQQQVQPPAVAALGHLTPILAIGSNAGPEQLARKFPLELFPDGVVVPVIQCVLRDFDVVYAPLISSYGSATATLEHSPGTEVAVFITYLTPTLQQRMHETEGAYNLCKLEGVQLLEGLSLKQHLYRAQEQPQAVQSSVYQYNHQHGTLHLPFSNPGASPVALAEIPAVNRRFPQLTQVQMQGALRAALQGITAEQLPGASQEQQQRCSQAGLQQLQGLPGVVDNRAADGNINSACVDEDGLDDWIMTNLEQPTLRRARVSALTRAARPFQYDLCDVVLTIGTSLSTSVK